MVAEAIAQLLQESGWVERLTCFPSISAVLPWVDEQPPNLLFIADLEADFVVGSTPFLPMCPDVPVICLDMQGNLLKVVTTTHITARLPDMLVAVEAFANSRV